MTIKDTDKCTSPIAYGGACVLDQCGRAIFGAVNFCKSKLAVDEEKLLKWVTIHEIGHILVLNSDHFKNFRDSNGRFRVPRDEYGEFKENISYKDCNGEIKHSERLDGVVEQVDKMCDPLKSKCAFEVVTPKVKEMVREHFDCNSLTGAELEWNSGRESSTCTLLGSHWEDSIFATDVMAWTHHMGGITISKVTLALCEDSGWYPKPKPTAINFYIFFRFNRSHTMRVKNCIPFF